MQTVGILNTRQLVACLVHCFLLSLYIGMYIAYIVGNYSKSKMELPRMNNRYLLALVSLCGLALSAPASAEIKWQTDSNSNCVGGTNYGNTCGFSAGGVNATTSAWANTGGSSNTQLETAYLGVFSGGLGVKNRDGSAGDANEGVSPEHAMDNNDRFDSILFSFSSKVVLSKVEIGFKDTDADISVLAYIGIGAPVLAGMTYANLSASSDWVKVGNYANLATGSTRSINTGGTASSYWLIGTYNNAFGSGTGLDTGNDHVKLLAVYGDKSNPPNNNVPVPSSMLLMGAGMLGFLKLRKR